MKRSKHEINGYAPKDYFAWLLDHTVIIANDDPELDSFRMMDAQGIIQLRVIDDTGCEKFAEFLYKVINGFLLKETDGRVRASKVEVYEHERNSASYE
jgi:6-pyruvoyltetrahydropterin/6-carboxytetrahydropterin synthase